MSSESTMEMNKKNEERVNLAHEIAMNSAIKYTVVAATVSTIATVIANKRSVGFNKYLNTAAKVSLPLMATLFAFGSQYEYKMLDVVHNPEEYGLQHVLAPRIDDLVKESQYSEPLIELPMYQKAMNYFYDHPFKLIALLGLPMTGMILKDQLAIKNMPVSQRIMCSRLYAQTGVLGITIITMVLRQYMHKHGRFPDGKDQITFEKFDGKY